MVGKAMRFGYEFSGAFERDIKSTSKKAQDQTDANERHRKGSMREGERQRKSAMRERAVNDLEARHNQDLSTLDRRLVQGDLNAAEHAAQLEKQYTSQSDKTAKLEAAQTSEVIGE